MVGASLLSMQQLGTRMYKAIDSWLPLTGWAARTTGAKEVAFSARLAWISKLSFITKTKPSNALAVYKPMPWSLRVTITHLECCLDMVLRHALMASRTGHFQRTFGQISVSIQRELERAVPACTFLAREGARSLRHTTAYLPNRTKSMDSDRLRCVPRSDAAHLLAQCARWMNVVVVSAVTVRDGHEERQRVSAQKDLPPS